MDKRSLGDCKIIDIPRVHDQRGILAVVEGDTIPFKMQRIYYLYDVPSDSHRGGHAHLKQESVIIALSGSFDIRIDNGIDSKVIKLNKPDKGLYLPTRIWREIENFSSGSVCLVMASTLFDENEYVRVYEAFKSLIS